jgi:hypothetical protein
MLSSSAVRVQTEEETKEDGISKKIYYNKHKFLKKDYHQDHQFYQAHDVLSKPTSTLSQAHNLVQTTKVQTAV